MVSLASSTANGQTIFAKNSDRPATECQPLILRERETYPSEAQKTLQFVTIPEARTTWRHVGSRPWWCEGYEHGFNEHQVVIGNQGLRSKNPEFTDPKLIGMEILRLGLERGQTAAEAVDAMTSAISEFGQGKFANEEGVRTYDNGYIVADPNEAYVIETAGHEWAVQKVDGAHSISNVYSVETNLHRLSAGAESSAISNGHWKSDRPFNFADAWSDADRSSGSGYTRRCRSGALLDGQSPGIDARSMMATLGDHSDNPDDAPRAEMWDATSICIHWKEEGEGGNTAASLVADLCSDGSRLPVYWCSFYSPCLGVFFPVFIEGLLPQALSIGNQTPDDASPWWTFYQLAIAARRAGPNGVAAVRSKWADLQESFFATAYQVANDAAKLTNAERCADAVQLTTSYMQQNADRVLETARSLIVELTPVATQA
jgi:secernin